MTRAGLRPGTRRRAQHPHARDKAALDLRGPPAARARHGTASAAAAQRTSSPCAPTRQMIRCVPRFRTIVDAAAISARSPASSPRRPPSVTPRGWYWPATCRFSIAPRCDTCCARATPRALATAYRSSHDGLPEPLCAIYEPASGAALEPGSRRGQELPAQVAAPARDVQLLDQPESARARQHQHRPRNTPRRDRRTAQAPRGA